MTNPHDKAVEAAALFASGDKLRNDALLELSEYERENDTLRAEVERLREVLWAAQSEYDQMIWGEDSEYLEAGNRVQQIIDAALKGNTNDEG
jgi:chromosome segregation and condensation protein ScpB